MSTTMPTLFDFDDDELFQPEPKNAKQEEKALIEETIEENSIKEIAEEAIDTKSKSETINITHHIVFESNDEEENIIEIPPFEEPSLTPNSIAPIIDEPVNDLDTLLYSEIIAQDYTAIHTLGISPLPTKEKKRDISTTNSIEEKKKTSLNQSALPEFDLENKYHTIGEVASLFKVNISHIRFWTTEFALKVRTTRKGDRLYTTDNIAQLRLIHHLVKENGFTIKGAKEKLKANKKAVNAQIDLKDKLNELKAKLERIKNNL